MRQGILHGRAHALANKAVEMIRCRLFIEKPEDRLVETDVDKLPCTRHLARPDGH